MVKFMQWQEIVLTTGQLIFVFSLLPSILSKNKPALSTSFITSVILYIFALIYLSLAFYLTAFAVTTTAIGWSVLAYQKYKIDRKLSS